MARPNQSVLFSNVTGRRWWVCLILALVHVAMVAPGAAQAPPRYVVVFTSFEQQFSPHNVFSRAFRTELTLRAAEPIQFIDVSLPSTRSPATESESTLAYLKTTFETQGPDLIVSVGGVAATFAQKHRPRIFPQTPMLFSSVDQRFVQNSSFAANEAAVSVAIDPSRLVDNIVRVLPDTTTVAVVLGTSQIEAAWRDALRQAFEPFKNRLQFIWFDDLPFEDILKRSAALPSGSAILFAHLGIDANGIPQVEERALPQLRAVANAPIFGVYDSQLGEGVVGGPALAIEELGRRAASVALRMLHGETPRGLTPPAQTLTVPTYDAAELERWGISENRLPSGSVVLFRQPTAWQRYRTPILAIAGIGLAQTSLLAGLLILHRKRKRADRLRLESEARFRLLADTAPVMIWVADENKKCTDANRAWLQFTGRTLEQERGDGWAEGVHKDDHDAAFETYSRACDRHEPFRMEYRLRRFDGEFRWILDTGIPRFTADGALLGYTGSAIDVTEQKLAQAALSTLSQSLIRAQEEERSRIARELHDDVCQRVAALTVELDEIRLHLPSDRMTLGRTLDELSRRSVAIGADLQALSHRLHSSKLEILGLAAAAESFCLELSAQQGVTITFSHDGVPQDLPHETALGLFRVMQEALMNAVKHSGIREFDVALRGTDDSLSLSVSDRGVGFDPDAILTTAGLGLVSMRERVSLIGGELFVHAWPGDGTTIHATVPTLNVESSTRHLPASADPGGLLSLAGGS